MQISNFGNVLRKLVQLKGITDGGLGAGPPAAGRFVGRFFVIFLQNKAILMPLNHILQVFRAI